MGQSDRDKLVYQHIWETEPDREPSETFRKMINLAITAASAVGRQARVADLGSGSGRHARWAAQCGCHVEAVDYDHTAILRQRSVPACRYTLTEADVREWLDPQRRAWWDAVACFDSLHHMVSDLDALGTLLDRVADIICQGSFLLVTLLCNITYSSGVVPAERLNVSPDEAEGYLRQHFHDYVILTMRRKPVRIARTLTMDELDRVITASYSAERVLVLLRR